MKLNIQFVEKKRSVKASRQIKVTYCNLSFWNNCFDYKTELKKELCTPLGKPHLIPQHLGNALLPAPTTPVGSGRCDASIQLGSRPPHVRRPASVRVNVGDDLHQTRSGGHRAATAPGWRVSRSWTMPVSTGSLGEPRAKRCKHCDGNVDDMLRKFPQNK